MYFPDPEGAEATINAARKAQLDRTRASLRKTFLLHDTFVQLIHLGEVTRDAEGRSRIAIRTAEGQALLDALSDELAAIASGEEPKPDAGDTTGYGPVDSGGSTPPVPVFIRRSTKAREDYDGLLNGGATRLGYRGDGTQRGAAPQPDDAANTSRPYQFTVSVRPWNPDAEGDGEGEGATGEVARVDPNRTYVFGDGFYGVNLRDHPELQDIGCTLDCGEDETDSVD